MLARLRRSVLFPVLPGEPFDPSWHHLRRGLWAERAVARWLWKRGFRIVAHRWEAETKSDLDLVAANDRLLLIAEVKLRAGVEEDPWRDVQDPHRVDLLRAALAEYLSLTRQRVVNLRVDGFLVRPQQTSPREPLIEVLEGYIAPQSIPGWKGIVAQPASALPD